METNSKGEMVYKRVMMFLSLLWRRVDDRCPGRVSWGTAWEVACRLYPESEIKNRKAGE